jgi:hypothetical protein
MQSLREELLTTREERDTALKEALLLKQVSLYFKHRDEDEEKAIQHQLFALQEACKKKDFIIERLKFQIDELKSAASSGDKKVVILDKFILEPTEWNLKF